MPEERQILMEALKFHGHKCWASTAGVRAGLAALDALGVERSGAKSLHAILENGYYHGAMCFGDGVQYTTGCTFGKGNMEKAPKGKLAVTLIDKAHGKSVRVAYKPTLQKQIKEFALHEETVGGNPADGNSRNEQWELVNLIWEAPQDQVLTVGPVGDHTWSEPEEVVRFAVCEGCGELVAEPYLRVVEGKPLCMDCSGTLSNLRRTEVHYLSGRLAPRRPHGFGMSCLLSGNRSGPRATGPKHVLFSEIRWPSETAACPLSFRRLGRMGNRK